MKQEWEKKDVLCIPWHKRIGPCVLAGGALLLFMQILTSPADAQEYYYKTNQVTDMHRYDNPRMGGFWGHHLGHLVRTQSRGLWYVDDSGNDVYVNPRIRYYRIDDSVWRPAFMLDNPGTIQQNTATIAVGDSIYTYGINVSEHWLEEAVFDPVTCTARYNRRIFWVGGSTNYVGASVSPSGTRVVWWTRVGSVTGQWLYVYHDAQGWHGPIETDVPGVDFSYVYAFFRDDTTLTVAGEVEYPHVRPGQRFSSGTAEIRLGKTLDQFLILPGDNLSASDIWVNPLNGDSHILGLTYTGEISYFYRAAGGDWPDTSSIVPVGSSGRSRFVHGPDGDLLLLFVQNGFKMMPFEKSQITGPLDFRNARIVNLSADEGFTDSRAMYPESPTYQTAPVEGINVVVPGEDFEYAGILRHQLILPNTSGVKINLSLPNGGETFLGRTTRKVSWFAAPNSGIDSVVLDWSPNNGLSWHSIVRSTRNSGTFLWNVPDTNTAGGIVRISSQGSVSVVDVSDAPFTISAVPNQKPGCLIEQPTQDTTIMLGQPLNLKGRAWDTDGYILNYRWTMGDGTTYNGILTSFGHTYSAAGRYRISLESKDNEGAWSDPDTVVVIVSDPMDVGRTVQEPIKEFNLEQNFPNPFNPHTTIRYALPERAWVQLAIYESTGQLVSVLVNHVEAAGHHEVRWNGANDHGSRVGSGVYLCRLESGGSVRSLKILLLR